MHHHRVTPEDGASRDLAGMATGGFALEVIKAERTAEIAFPDHDL
jgi:hypothetical protein